MVLDRYRIAKGLVGSPEIVFDEPLSEALVESIAIRDKVPELEKFAIKSAIEAFIKRIVSRGFVP